MSTILDEKRVSFVESNGSLAENELTLTNETDFNDENEKRLRQSSSDESENSERSSNRSKTESLDDLAQNLSKTIDELFSRSENRPTNDEPTKSSSSWLDLMKNLKKSKSEEVKLVEIRENLKKSLENLKSSDEQIEFHDETETEEEIEPILTAEQVINEIDFMLRDFNEFPEENPSIEFVKATIEQLQSSIEVLSAQLVEQLARRDELEFEKETKNQFISLHFAVQNKKNLQQIEKTSKLRSILSNHFSVESGKYLTTVIPFDPQHPKHLSVEHLQSLNKILLAIVDDSNQVPELLTNYILKIICSS